MTEHADQIRQAFASHEHLAPDAAAVFARAQDLARTYRRRRVGAQAAGGAVLGAGLLAGGIGLPRLMPGGVRQGGVVHAAAGSSATATIPSPSPSSPPPSEDELNRQRDAYFAAGYDLHAAEKLATLWQMSAQPSELGAVKAEAGRRLLAGETLPVKPDPAAVVGVSETRATTAFFGAGYDYSDAQKLAMLWKTADPYRAKVLAGEKLLAGETLPVAPNPTAVDTTDVRATNAFFRAGYDYADAQRLAALWKTADPYGAKVLAGEKLLAGKKLPFAP